MSDYDILHIHVFLIRDYENVHKRVHDCADVNVLHMHGHRDDDESGQHYDHDDGDHPHTNGHDDDRDHDHGYDHNGDDRGGDVHDCNPHDDGVLHKDFLDL